MLGFAIWTSGLRFYSPNGESNRSGILPSKIRSIRHRIHRRFHGRSERSSEPSIQTTRGDRNGQFPIFNNFEKAGILHFREENGNECEQIDVLWILLELDSKINFNYERNGGKTTQKNRRDGFHGKR